MEVKPLILSPRKLPRRHTRPSYRINFFLVLLAVFILSKGICTKDY